MNMNMKLTQILEAITKDQILRTYQRNPRFFNTPQNFKLGVEGGIFDFTLEISPDRLDRYIDGDYTLRRYTNKDGREVKIGLFETILSGDTWDLWDSISYDGDWEGALDYHINQENENKIKVIIDRYITESGYDPEDFKDHTLQGLIEEFDEDDEIKSAIRSALDDAKSESYHNYLHETLREACEELGEVIKFDDTGVDVKIDFKFFVEAMFDKDYDSADEVIETIDDRCNWDPECFWEEMMDPYGEKPIFSPDDRWYPDVDDKSFNMILDDRLDEIG
jgi:hypothetical protein